MFFILLLFITNKISKFKRFKKIEKCKIKNFAFFVNINSVLPVYSCTRIPRFCDGQKA